MVLRGVVNHWHELFWLLVMKDAMCSLYVTSGGSDCNAQRLNANASDSTVTDSMMLCNAIDESIVGHCCDDGECVNATSTELKCGQLPYLFALHAPQVYLHR
jgi:hypothetical protein